jgi:hypothetical protein
LLGNCIGFTDFIGFSRQMAAAIVPQKASFSVFRTGEVLSFLAALSFVLFHRTFWCNLKVSRLFVAPLGSRLSVISIFL